MHETTRKRPSKFLAMLGSALALGFGIAASAQDAHKHGAPLHGGKVAMTKEYHFEAVFAKDGLKLHPRTHDDKPIDASKLTGTATFYHPNSPKPWFEQKLTATPAKSGQETTSLQATIDLSKVPASGAKVAFKVSGLPEAAETTATFTVPFALAASKELVVAEATKDDAKAVAAQKTCPVSKEELDSMGGPWKVSRGDQSTFICCKNCLKKVQADPDKYLGATTSASKSGHDHDH